MNEGVSGFLPSFCEGPASFFRADDVVLLMSGDAPEKALQLDIDGENADGGRCDALMITRESWRLMCILETA